MFDPSIHVSWSEGLLWLGGIGFVAFLVAWALSDLRPTKRVFYVPVLAAVTGAATTAYVVWSDAGSGFWTEHWGYGIAGAVVAGAFLTFLLSRRQRTSAGSHPITGATLAWDGLVYGAAEGLLLSVLPVVVAWQTFSSNGWDDGWQSVAAGAAAIVASVAVIVVHHLGYPDFRRNKAKIGQAVLGCGVLSLAYLLTASVIAPILAHAALHVAAVRNDMELPPHEETRSASDSRWVKAA